MNSFTRSVDLLHRAMDVSSLRYQVTANNLANAEVPNFKRTSVNFESELKRALESEANSKDDFHMITTDSRHIESATPRDYRDVEPRRVLDYTTTAKVTENISANHGRAQYHCCRLEYKDGELYAYPIRGKSGLITTLAGAEGYFCIPRDCEGLPKFAQIQVTITSGE